MWLASVKSMQLFGPGSNLSSMMKSAPHSKHWIYIVVSQRDGNHVRITKSIRQNVGQTIISSTWHSNQKLNVKELNTAADKELGNSVERQPKITNTILKTLS